MKMPACAVSTCPVNSNNIATYESVVFVMFPTDIVESESWWKVCKRKDRETYTRNDRICSMHFEETCFDRDLINKVLNSKKNYIFGKLCHPTLLLPEASDSFNNYNQKYCKRKRKGSNNLHLKHASFCEGKSSLCEDTVNSSSFMNGEVRVQRKGSITHGSDAKHEYNDTNTVFVKTEVNTGIYEEESFNERGDGCTISQQSIFCDIPMEIEHSPSMKAETFEEDSSNKDCINSIGTSSTSSDPLQLIEDSVEKHAHSEKDNCHDKATNQHSNVKSLKSSSNLEKKSFTCDSCSFATVHKHSLTRHILVHVNGKLFSCKLCSHKTFRKENFKKHMLVHTDFEPFCCEKCLFKTKQRSELRIHMLMHNEIKPFSCEVCSFKTVRQDSLKRHMLIHNETIAEKTFSCELCSFKGIRQDILTQHMVLHKEEKPYSCKLCSYKAVRADYLKTHMMVHNAEKPFSCQMCSFKSKRIGNLSQHIMLVHTDEKPLSCELCPFKAKYRRSMRRHILTHTV